MDIVRYDYNRILEIKPKGVGKGIATSLILDVVMGGEGAAAKRSGAHSPPPPFVMCVGDDRADEEMFEALQASPLLLLPDAQLPSDAARATTQPPLTLAPPPPALESAPLNPLKQKPTSASASSGSASASTSPAFNNLERSRRLMKGGASTRALFQPSLFTTTVGIKPSAAHYYCNDSDEVCIASLLPPIHAFRLPLLSADCLGPEQVIEMIEALAAASDSSMHRKPKKQQLQPLSPSSLSPPIPLKPRTASVPASAAASAAANAKK